jgi:N-methylhydantoinase A
MKVTKDKEKGEKRMSLLMTIDNGGTFTDACLINGDQVIRSKTLTTPYDLTKCFIEVIREVSKELYGKENIRKLLQELEYLRYSTTAGTNAVVQRKGPRLGLIVREGTDISTLTDNETKREMFETMVNDRIVEINPDLEGEELEANIVAKVNHLLSQGTNRLVISLNGKKLIEDEIKLKKTILRKYPRHLLGAIPMLFSHELTEDNNDSQRTWTALINSFLHTDMERFLYNSENFLRENRAKNPLLIYHNDGNSARVAKTTAIKTYGSGPRGGMEGTKAIASHYKIPALLTLDVGGTTSDIGLVKQEKITVDRYGHIEGIPTSFSLSDLISIGAGGSSIYSVQDGNIKVGPESMGAAPGPACFGRGGIEPTVTDVYLLMGILDPHSYFRGSMVLDKERAKTAVDEKIINQLNIEFESALIEMEKIYYEKIADGLSEYKKQAEDCTLLAFGGAGPMSACGVAEATGIKSILIPRLAAVFSAFGIGFSDIAHEYQAYLSDVNEATIYEKLTELKEKAERDMFAEGFNINECQTETFLSFYHDGTEEVVSLENISDAIRKVKNNEDIRIHLHVIKPINHFEFKKETVVANARPIKSRIQEILNQTGKWEKVPVYKFEEMSAGTTGHGPALIEDEYFTCRILEGWEFEINENKDIFIHDKRGE